MEPYSMGDLFVEYGFFLCVLEEKCVVCYIGGYRYEDWKK